MAKVSRLMDQTMMQSRITVGMSAHHRLASMSDLKTMSSETNMPEGGMAVMQRRARITMAAPKPERRM